MKSTKVKWAEGEADSGLTDVDTLIRMRDATDSAFGNTKQLRVIPTAVSAFPK